VAGPGLAQVPDDPVERSRFVQSFDLTAPVADVAADAQRVVKVAGRSRYSPVRVRTIPRKTRA
jgi:hypothetical protein